MFSYIINNLALLAEKQTLTSSSLKSPPSSFSLEPPPEYGFAHPLLQLIRSIAQLSVGTHMQVFWLFRKCEKITYDKYNRCMPNLTRNDGEAFEKVTEKKAVFG